jgi:hypothetical protein
MTPPTVTDLKAKYPLIDIDRLRPLTPFPNDAYAQASHEFKEAIVKDPESFGIKVLTASVLADPAKAASELRQAIYALAAKKVGEQFAAEKKSQDDAATQVAECFAEIKAEQLEGFPAKMADIISHQAWEQSHSYGYAEVIRTLRSSAEDWKDFAKLAKEAGL